MHIQTVGPQAVCLDDLFYHRHPRKVRKDGTVQWAGQLYEVPYEYANSMVIVVIDPHAQKALRIESQAGQNLGAVIPLNTLANTHRKRQRPLNSAVDSIQKTSFNAIEKAHQDYTRLYGITHTHQEDE